MDISAPLPYPCVKVANSTARKLIHVTKVPKIKDCEIPKRNAISCSGKPTLSLSNVKNKQFSVHKINFRPKNFFFEFR